MRRVRKRARTTPGGQEGSIEAAVRKLLEEDAPEDIQDAARRALHRPRAHGAPDRGATAHDAGGPAAHLRAHRPARRPAPDAQRGLRDPAPPARGDLVAVANECAAHRAALATRRGAHGPALLRRDALPGHALPVPHGRPRARPGTLDRRGRGRRAAAGPARDSGHTGTRPPAIQCLPALGLVGRRRPRRPPARHRRDHARRRPPSAPTTSCAASSTWPRA